MYVYLWLVHVIWQKPTQYYKAVILQLKINLLKKKSTFLGYMSFFQLKLIREVQC